VPGTATEQPVTVDRVRSVGGHASAMMWVLAGLAVASAGGEVWRYVLLLRSRTGALSSGVVTASDVLVGITAILTLAFALLTAVVLLWWLHLARHAAADLVAQRPARSDWQVLVYLLVPGVNLAMAGVILAELEHQVLRRPADERPEPTRQVKIWWAAWVASSLLFLGTVLWRFRDSAQARADGVVLSALTDLAAAGMAVLTALMIRRLVMLLAPIDSTTLHFQRVVRVEGAPEPPLRAVRAVPSRR
jgi:hypothetical protein